MAKPRKHHTALPLGDEMEAMVKMGFTPGLVDRYAIPPFSVLDARQGYWQERKRLWIKLGIRSELGRGEGVLMDSDAITTESLNYDHNREKNHGSTPAPDQQGRGLSDTLAPRPGNNLLGMSYETDEYRRSHAAYREKGKGKADARAFGLDMMRGEGAEKYDYVRDKKSPNAIGNLSTSDTRGQGQKDRYGTDTSREYVKADDDVIPTGTGPAVFSDGAINPDIARSRKPVTTRDAGPGSALAAPIHPYDNYVGDGEVSVMGTSIFDPVLTELMYCWFSPAGGKVLDPFAGGSVRGIVAAATGRDYTGIDLRPEQAAANQEQWERLGPTLPGECRWIVGDGRDVAALAADKGPYDFILTCPPYYDLERYSYDPADLSNAGSYKEFMVAFRDVIVSAVGLLAPDRFAAVVVGDIRDDKGFYRNFPAHTIGLFQRYAGMTLYNEAILVTAVGSLPVRIGKQFEAGRKLGRTHQNVLVFYKGDPKHIKGMLGEIKMGHEGAAG